MKRIILTYGIAAGVITIVSMAAGLYLTGSGEGYNFSVWLGYLTMTFILSIIFVGIKRYRDDELGGIIRFGSAFLLGLGIAIVSGLAYVGSWELNLALTDYAFIDEYTRAYIDNKEAAGIGAAELEQVVAEMAQLKARYNMLWYRMPMTFLEIFPVGLLISLISAAILRNPRVLPARD